MAVLVLKASMVSTKAVIQVIERGTEMWIESLGDALGNGGDAIYRVENISSKAPIGKYRLNSKVNKILSTTIRIPTSY